ncbi:MAG: tRNA (adenosine(37)-N6)-threonylcarbamoyltransferase complex dimerization subunit type 1 TsaB [Acholeplasmataceae bacterium]|nr:tRNA (adenosine(37)-N6)-threonylcarbamoyltransferase complex dimerization subunit type 1 TsaB [Acholeplasmataceae bacterium]HOA63280.1 tRNA (adenosine(37)-N6)-threonylcarbamoyltransferase complex dimerization subunit type 1 TsaB [Bacilli bacterium]HQA19376.1 tRNA (adenosine(37)-N6)-threonylcarbamoyltransferase complex dimerization subunit type 1 TsaB [Bacilli bacterium]HQD92097.1 tRNA (adenosine(37)-N6)-threonylcarbamoyltransferase complex dimerization subunit type 1 TsaB [Bacilli bacterium]
MKTMILDTSSNVLYISFVIDNKEIYKVEHIGKNDHSDNLIPLIKKGLMETNLSIFDFDQFIVGIGPGSYTGVRLALSVGKMFAWTANKKLYTISSLDILSSGKRISDGIYVTALKAKRGFVYTNVIERKDNSEKYLVTDTYMSDEDFTQLVNQFPQAVIIKDNYFFNFENIINSPFLQEHPDVHLVVPNYLRGAL